MKQQTKLQSWEEKKIGDVIETTSGGTPSRGIKRYYSGNIPWLKSGELRDNTQIENSEEHITEEAIKSSSAKIFPEKSVLIAMYGATTGKLGILKKPCSTNQAVCAFLPNNNFDKKFIFYFLLNKRNQIINKGKGGAQPNISQTVLKSILIPLPPLSTQSLIVSSIESNFSKIDNAIKNLKSAKKKIGLYRKAVLKKAFEKGEDWKEKRIGDVVITNPQKSEIKDLSDDLEISFIPMKFVSEKSKKIINQETKKLSQVRKGYTYFKEDDVILAKITPCFENGKMAIAKDLINGIGFGSTEYHVFRFEKEVITPFLFYFLQQNKFKGEAKRNMTGTAGQLRVPIKFIENFPIAFPPSLPAQQAIVSFIESKFSVIDKVEEAVNNSLAKAEKLKKSILKSAFEGRLVGE